MEDVLEVYTRPHDPRRPQLAAVPSPTRPLPAHIRAGWRQALGVPLPEPTQAPSRRTGRPA